MLDKIAAAGNDGSFEPSPGGGAPKIPVTITTMTVVELTADPAGASPLASSTARTLQRRR